MILVNSLTEALQDIWLDVPNWDRQKILSELLVKRIEGVKWLGGFRSKGFEEVEFSVTPPT